MTKRSKTAALVGACLAVALSSLGVRVDATPTVASSGGTTAGTTAIAVGAAGGATLGTAALLSTAVVMAVAGPVHLLTAAVEQ